MSIAKIVAALVERGEEELAEELLAEMATAGAGHHFFDGKNYYVDTAFINSLSRFWPEGYKGLSHMGLGEFMIKLSDGTEIEFDRMRGKDFPGKSGRSHQVYDNKNGKGVKKMIQLAEQKGGSELVASVEDYEIDAELDEAIAAETIDMYVAEMSKDAQMGKNYLAKYKDDPPSMAGPFVASAMTALGALVFLGRLKEAEKNSMSKKIMKALK